MLKIILKIVKCFFICLVIFFVVACNNVSLNEEDENDYVEEVLNVEAINDYAFDVGEINETKNNIKDHHEYPHLDLGDSNPIVISEKLFLTKIANLYNDIDKYKDRDVSIDGLYGKFVSYDGSFDFPIVYRNGPGCCRDDKYGGIYLVNVENAVPEGVELVEDDFISVLGSPFIYEYTDSKGNISKYLFLISKSITVVPNSRRGAEMVND